MQKITGIDFSGYKVVVEARQINHILRDHGENGRTDQSMKDIRDIAKIEYALSSPDSIEKAGKTQAYSYMRNGYNRTADTVRYEKKIGEKSYYVIQALPIANKKTLYIVSAFIGESGYKKGTSQLIDAKSPNATAKHGSVVVPMNSIPDSAEKVNTSDKKSSESAKRYSMDEAPSLPRTAGTMSVGQYKKRVADLMKAKSYTKDQIYDILKKVPMTDMASAKTREQIAEAVWQIFNEDLTAGERQAAAHDISEFLVAKLIMIIEYRNAEKRFYESIVSTPAGFI